MDLGSVVRLTLGRQPSTQEFWQASTKVGKKKMETVFAKELSICVWGATSRVECRTVLASPMSVEIARFCSTNVGRDVYVQYGVWNESVCLFWDSLFYLLNGSDQVWLWIILGCMEDWTIEAVELFNDRLPRFATKSACCHARRWRHPQAYQSYESCRNRASKASSGDLWANQSPMGDQ